MKDKTPKVVGIGGIFFRTTDPATTKDWYREKLGIVMNDYGASFESRNANNPEETNYLQWSLFDQDTKYFDPSEKQFMINYRVQNLEGLLENLKEQGVTIIGELQAYSYGKFAHIMDNDGNKIELWEPVDTVLKV